MLTSPVETHVTPVHQGEVWLQTPEQETSCHCHSPELSPRQPSGPWRRRSAGTGSCSAAKWTERGYLFTSESIKSSSWGIKLRTHSASCSCADYRQ